LARVVVDPVSPSGHVPNGRNDHDRPLSCGNAVRVVPHPVHLKHCLQFDRSAPG
jgi:hypothetical protein